MPLKKRRRPSGPGSDLNSSPVTGARDLDIDREEGKFQGRGLWRAPENAGERQQVGYGKAYFFGI